MPRRRRILSGRERLSRWHEQRRGLGGVGLGGDGGQESPARASLPGGGWVRPRGGLRGWAGCPNVTRGGWEE